METEENLKGLYVRKETKDRFWSFPIGGKFAEDRLSNILNELERRRKNEGNR